MKSIKNKLSLLIAVLIFGTAIIIAGFTLITFYNNMIDQLEENVESLSDGYSMAVQNQIQNFKKELRLSASLEAITEDNAEKRDALHARIADTTGLEYIALANENGETTRNSNIAHREYFQKALAGDTYMSSPLVNLVDNTVTIMLATPVSNDKEYKGILYGGLLYDTFSEVISDIKVGEGGYAFIVDKAGVIVAHPDTSIVEGMTNFIEEAKNDTSLLPLAETISRMTAGESGVSYANFNGVDLVYGFAPIEGPEGWSVAIAVPVSQVMDSVINAIILCVIVVLLLIVISMILALYFARAIAKPIIAATQRIELLAEGNLSAPVDFVKGKDETARLSVALSNTVNEMQSYIGDISSVLIAMADNDFTVASTVDYKGEFAPIKKALHNITVSLNQTLAVIGASADQVNSGAAQISSGALDLASGATEQAASIEQLSASITNVSEQDAENLKSLRQATQYVYEANSGVQESADKMVDMTNAMDKIASSSNQISNITKLIEDIAFQTNILALNAAIEAARAGSAGKGFAVVAEEVRTLAAKSAEAAGQTAELIAGSTEAVKLGTAIVGDTAKMLSKVAETTKQVTDSIASIEAASSEQAIAIDQISQGIDQVSNVVQVSAATAEESSAASQELSSLAASLQDAVARFKLLDTSLHESLMGVTDADFSM